MCEFVLNKHVELCELELRHPLLHGNDEEFDDVEEVVDERRDDDEPELLR